MDETIKQKKPIVRWVVGIDPDLTKSGYAIWDKEERVLKEFGSKDFWGLLELLNEYKNELIIIEAGWLNKKVNWHLSELGTRSEKIAYRVGQNHTIGQLLVDYCKKNGISVITKRPSMRKMKQEEFKKITGIKHTTNQDVRDAIMLVYGF
ncbi:hypothetical protein [Caldisericum sp.]|uniref:hypothetical protein n=1 Tax=Caldisericum sp. TaxID=2499687 RepID=UPI003D0ED39B